MNKIKTNFGKQILFTCIALLIALPVRVYQYLYVIAEQSGFYTTWRNPTVFGLYALCIVLIAAVLALCAKGEKKAIYGMPDGKQKAIAIGALVSAIAFLAEGAYAAFRTFQIASGAIMIQQLVLGNNAGKPTLFFTALQALFAVLSAVFMLAFSISFFSGKQQYKKIGVLAISPAIWGVSRLMIDFTQTVSYRYVSELLFELLMIVFICLFFVAFAKFTVGALKARVQMRLFGYGLLAVFFGWMSAVPRYVMVLMGRKDALYKSISMFEIADLILPVFIACFIFAVAACKQYKAVEEYAAGEQQAE